MRKLLKGIFILAVGLFSATQECRSQNQDFSVWLDTQSIDAKLVISGWASNHTQTAKHLNYLVKLDMGDSTLINESSTLALPGQATLLLKAVFVVPEGKFKSAELSVFFQNEFAGSASIFGNYPTLLPPERTDSLMSKSLTAEDIEIHGLILDETRSKLAHDFYELFYNAWNQADSLPSGALVVIRELPARVGLGARIAVEIGDQELTQLNLQPRQDLLEELATQLLEALVSFFQNPNEEIEAEELQGTGIY